MSRDPGLQLNSKTGRMELAHHRASLLSNALSEWSADRRRERDMCGQSEITEFKVVSFLNQFETAQSTKSFANVVDLIHPNALFRFNDGDYRGLPAIQSAFESTWAQDVEDDRYHVSNIEVVNIDSNSAAATFQFNWSGKGPKGPFHIVGRGTSILVLHGGKLKVMVEHLSH